MTRAVQEQEEGTRKERGPRSSKQRRPSGRRPRSTRCRASSDPSRGGKSPEMTGQGAAAAPHRHGERLPSSRRADRGLVPARALPAPRLTGAGVCPRPAASAPPRRRQGGAASEERRAGGGTGRCDGDARLRPPGATRGRGRRLVESRRGAGPRGGMRTVELRSGSSQGLGSGMGCVLGARSWDCGAEERRLLPRACGSRGSPASRTYLSSRPRTVSGASGLGPLIAATQRIPQTIGALAGFSLLS